MAIVRTVHLYEFLARVDTSQPAPAPIVGMHVTNIERFSEDGNVLSERPLPAQPVDFAALAALMSDENLASAVAAFQAEIASRL
jgi:hypothetical protein